MGLVGGRMLIGEMGLTKGILHGLVDRGVLAETSVLVNGQCMGGGQEEGFTDS